MKKNLPATMEKGSINLGPEEDEGFDLSWTSWGLFTRIASDMNKRKRPDGLAR